MNDILQKYKQDLAIKGYSKKTQTTYFGCVKKFLGSAGKPSDTLDKSDIKSHLYRILESPKCSCSTMNQTYSAIKYFFQQTLGRPWEIENVPRVKKQYTLPHVFTQDEVFSIIKGARSLKHKAMFMLAYESGLRVSEIVSLKPEHIKSDKMRIRIEQGKGHRDRYTILSEMCLKYLREYWRAYKPVEWFFEGYGRGKRLSIRACEHAFDKAKRIAGIQAIAKRGIHTLRHSFPTHFLEAGGGIFQLQKFLGHKHIKTTLVYAHMQEEKTIARSPLDVYGKPGIF